MRERRDRLDLALESREGLGIAGDTGRKDLDGDVPIETGVAGTVDLPHPAGTDGTDDFVRAQTCARRQSHRGALEEVRPARRRTRTSGTIKA